MRLTKLSFLAATTLVAAACGSSTNTSSTDELAAAVPDVPGISLEATGAASEDTQLSSAVSMPADAGSPSGLEFLPVIRQGIHDLNAGVQQFFAPIGQLISTQGTDIVVGTSKSYGPVDQGGVTFLLTVKRFAPNRYAWELQGKTTGAAPSVAFTLLAAGTLSHAANDEVHRGRGQIGFDFDAFATVSPGFMGTGKLYVAYSNFDVSVANGVAGDAKTLVYVLDKFSIDTSAHPIVSAAFVGHKTLAGVRAARVLYYGEIPQLGGNTDLNELLLGRVRFNPGVGGRADALVTGGNVTAGSLIYGAECWDVSENLAWRKVWDCTTTPLVCTVASEQGNVMACAVGLQDDTYEAPTDAGSTTLEPGAPDPLVVPITAIPSFDNPS
jgi:hypothetical protein